MTDDEGFTLIEAVIALLVMSIAVVALVGALVGLIQLTEEHRGHAVAETAVRSYGDAVEALVTSSAVLTAAAASGTTSITVADASTLPSASGTTYLQIEREIVQLSAVNRSTGVLTVARGQGGTTAAAHAAGVSLVPLWRCPLASQLTPPTSAYALAPGITAPSITGVEYWSPTAGAFVARTSCETEYEVLCPDLTGNTDQLSAECGYGLFRVSLSASTSGDSRLRGISTTTALLVRTGSL